jgi:hypothetical protein
MKMRFAGWRGLLSIPLSLVFTEVVTSVNEFSTLPRTPPQRRPQYKGVRWALTGAASAALPAKQLRRGGLAIEGPMMTFVVRLTRGKVGRIIGVVEQVKTRAEGARGGFAP